MKVFVVVAALISVSCALPAGDLQAAAQTQQGAAAAPPAISWGKCPQLQPSDNERQQKALVVDQCLQKVAHPDPNNSTQTEFQKHREAVTTCALQTEGWFDANGAYKFDRARSEIVNKKLANDVQEVVLKKHDECQKESTSKFANQYVAQVQMYQACMDYHISQICGIQVQHPQGGQGPAQGNAGFAPEFDQ